jgi:hypothetical protein
VQEEEEVVTAPRAIKALVLTIALTAMAAGTASAATTLTLTPTSANFPDTKVGTNSAPKGFILKIGCDTPFCSPSFNPSPSLTGDFTVLNGCPPTINVVAFVGTENPSCLLAVSFAPTTPGLRTGTLSTGSGGPTATVSGVGTQDAAAVQAKGKCRKGGKKKGAASKKKCRKKKR